MLTVSQVTKYALPIYMGSSSSTWTRSTRKNYTQRADYTQLANGVRTTSKWTTHNKRMEYTQQANGLTTISEEHMHKYPRREQLVAIPRNGVSSWTKSSILFASSANKSFPSRTHDAAGESKNARGDLAGM